MRSRGYGWLIGRLLLTALTCYGFAYAFMESTPPSLAWLIAFSVLLLYSGAWTVRLAINPASFLWRLEADLKENRFEEFHLLLAPFAFAAIFAIVAREAHAFKPDLFDVSLLASSPDARSWLAFSLDHVARAVLLDFFETYKIRLSLIDYRPELLLATTVFAFKTVLALVFLAVYLSVL